MRSHAGEALYQADQSDRGFRALIILALRHASHPYSAPDSMRMSGNARTVCAGFVACLVVRTAPMRTMSAFIASLAVALMVASALAGRGGAQGIVTGTVGQYAAGEWISVANETTDPMGFQI